jgi:hypothetical protein
MPYSRKYKIAIGDCCLLCQIERLCSKVSTLLPIMLQRHYSLVAIGSVLVRKQKTIKLSSFFGICLFSTHEQQIVLNCLFSCCRLQSCVCTSFATERIVSWAVVRLVRFWRVGAPVRALDSQSIDRCFGWCWCLIGDVLIAYVNRHTGGHITSMFCVSDRVLRYVLKR